MKKHPYQLPETAELDLLYESILCESEEDIDIVGDYGDGGDPFVSF